MSPMLGRTILWISLAAALSTLCACHKLFRMRTRRMHIRPVTSWAMRPRPVGRFLVDLPETAEFGHWYQTYGASGRISVVPGVTPVEFYEAVNKRADELRAIPHDEGGTRLYEEIPLDLPHGRAILYWDDSWSHIDPLKSDSYILRGDYLYKFEGETWCDPEMKATDLKWFNQIFNAIRPLQPDEVPREHGFCFEHSILVDPVGKDGPETIIASALWRDHPDVIFRFSTLTNYQTLDPPLLQRVEKASFFSGTRVLRSGPRNLASGEPGEEHLERVRERNGKVGHLFAWEAQGRTLFDDYHPQVRMEMSTGNGRHGPEHASLSDADALKLWDAVVGSIRLRWAPPPAR